MHHNTPGAERLLTLHRELFAPADRDGVVAYELGNCIADLTQCGCQGRKNDAARWREVLAAYGAARAAPEAGKTQVKWAGKTVPLLDALQAAETLARKALETGSPEQQRWPGGR